MDQSHQLLGTGLYPLHRASRLVGEDVRTVRRWLKGYSWKHQDGRRSSEPLWPLQYAADDDLASEQVLGFKDLLELRTVARFVQCGVSLRVVRETIDVARQYLGDYPLHARRFVTDGRKIFLEAVERAGEEARMLDVRNRQFAIESVIRPSLIEGIEYGADAQALRWYPEPKRKLIVLDPALQFGEPIIADAGVPTDTLAAAFKAEQGDAQRVARLYRVTPQAVRAAVAFEQKLAA
ncbi:DUF433 domain-containing protein [Aquabacterium sp.]|uniref:DUF433 domain-containing protein n=1 Tax=Aquabacterium sp. TaxID=1872578 RepID=UPI003BB16E16